MLLPFYCRLNSNILFGCVKLIGYKTPAANMVSSNPCVGSSPRIKISFPLLSLYTYQLILSPKIMAFFLKFPLVNKNFAWKSNPMPQPVYLYLSRSAFLVSSTDPNK